MKKVFRYVFPAAAFLLSLVTSLFWVALRVNYAGISKFLGADTNPSFLVMNLPVMVCVLAWVGCLLAFFGILFWEKKKAPAVVGAVITLVMAVAAVIVVLFGAKDYLRFIMVHFRESLAITGCVAAFALALFIPVKNNWFSVTWKSILVAAAILIAVVLGYQLRPCDFTYGAVVYAVEDDYQIVFSTSDSAVAWVEIGGESYYDLYAGSMRSADKVHKITVPQGVLDEAKGYTICAQQMIYRGPFGGYKGETISQSYDFRPVDVSDGIQHVALSDVHEAVEAATAAATTRDNTDFVVLVGDLISMVETEKDCQLANELAHGITGGEIPVIYARGNHEIKGEYGELLYKYVGSKNQEFYYWVTLGEDIFAVVLDIGEDHEDDWWEYYGTAQFELYRAAQTEMLEEILEAGEYENYRYRMAICHVPVTYVGSKGYFEEFNNSTTALLNEMDVDIALSGHKHVMWPMLPGQTEPHSELIYSEGYKGVEGKKDGGYLTDHNFPAFLVGRRSNSLTGDTQSDGYTEYTCLFTDANFETGRQISNYVNAQGGIPTGYWPFMNGTYSDIGTELKR